MQRIPQSQTTSYLVRPGVLVRYRVEVIGPQPAPDSGAEWPEELDWPGLHLTFYLPTGSARSQYVRADLLSTADVMGERVTLSWGHAVDAEPGDQCGWRCRSETVRAATLDECHARLSELVSEAVARLGSILDSRAARLRQRAELLAASGWTPGDEQ